MSCEHTWTQASIKLLKDGNSNRRKTAGCRDGFVCSSCGLNALPPKSGKKLAGWAPPK